MDNKFKDLLENIKFGLEIETCMHNLSLITDSSSFFFNYLLACFVNKSRKLSPREFKWRLIDDPDDILLYDTWYLKYDGSVYCKYVEPSETLDYMMTKSKFLSSKDIKLTFFPIEINTPILTMDTSEYSCGRGWYIFYLVWQGWIMDENLIYSVNKSQGLHVNLSHPQQDRDRFIQIWDLFEPIIMRLIDPDRLINIGKYAQPFREQKSISALFHHSAINFHDERIEIRVYQGTVNLEEIYNWTMLCIILLIHSIIGIKVDEDILERRSKDKYVNTFFRLIPDTQLRSYFSKIFNLHRGAFPKYDENIKRTIKLIDRPWEMKDKSSIELIESISKIECSNQNPIRVYSEALEEEFKLTFPETLVNMYLTTISMIYEEITKSSYEMVRMLQLYDDDDEWYGYVLRNIYNGIQDNKYDLNKVADVIQSYLAVESIVFFIRDIFGENEFDEIIYFILHDREKLKEIINDPKFYDDLTRMENAHLVKYINKLDNTFFYNKYDPTDEPPYSQK